MLSHFSHVPLFVTLWAVAFRAPLSMGFSRQEYWSALPCPPPEDLPDPGIKPASLASPALACGFFTTCDTWKVLRCRHIINVIEPTSGRNGAEPGLCTTTKAHALFYHLPPLMIQVSHNSPVFAFSVFMVGLYSVLSVKKYKHSESFVPPSLHKCIPLGEELVVPLSTPRWHLCATNRQKNILGQ